MFPSINQSWMDTYIEQLIRNGISPQIYTNNKSSKKYHKKVDKLGLKKYIIDFDLSKNFRIGLFLRTLVFDPGKFIFILLKSLMIVKYLTGKYRLPWIKVYLKLLRFGLLKNTFKNIDVVHSHSEILTFEFMLFAIMFDTPLIYTFHGLLPKGIKQIDENKRRALLGESTNVVVNTNFAKKQVVELGCPSNKIIISPQGLPIEDFPFRYRNAPENGENLMLLTVGRLHVEKGQEIAFEALNKLIVLGVNVQWHFVGEGPDRAKFNSEVNRLKISNHVVFHGALRLESIRKLYQQCHLFVLPSLGSRGRAEWEETQGVVLQEAQASGCIPIATKVGGIPECVNDGKDAILIEDRSSQAIVDAILFFLEHPKDWKRYQENARRNVEENFSADVIGKRMAEILVAAVDKATKFNA